MDTRALLRGVFEQSYGRTMGDTDREPPVVRAPASGAATSLPWVGLDGLAYPPAPAPAVAPSASLLARLLLGALGVQRHEPANRFNPHRGYPSARSVFPVHAWLVDAGRVYHYDPVGHALEAVDGAPPPVDGPAILLAATRDAFPEGYGPIRRTLGELEGGHVARTLVLVARALGLAPALRLDLPEDTVRAALALDDAWTPLCAVTFGAAQPEAAAHPRPPLLVPRPRPLTDVLFARNAGRGNGGLSGRAAPLRPEALHTALTLGLERPPAGLDLPLRVYLVAERTGGLEDGVHEVGLDGPTLTPLRRGRFLHAVQEAFSYPATSVNIRSLNLVWLFVIDPPAIVAAGGARGLTQASLALGWLAQGLCCAAAAEGLFARPVRSYREAALDDLLGLGPTEMVGYELLCGQNRFTDLCFDLRPPAPGGVL